MLSRSKQWHMIDYVITLGQDIQDIKINRAIRGAKCWTNHRLVRYFISFYMAPVHHRKPKLTQAPLNTTKSENPDGREKFHSLLNYALHAHGSLTRNPIEKWTQFKQMMTESTQTVLRPKTWVHQCWLDKNNENTEMTLQSKKNHFKHLKSKAQRELQ